MSPRTWLVLALIVIAFGWWNSDLSPRVPQAPRLQGGGVPVGCARPPSVAEGREPLQTPAPAALLPFALEDAILTPLAGISIDARVLSRRDYHSGETARLSPTDLALGWQDMARDAVLAHLSISQSGRWYQYRWRDAPPLEPSVIARQSANMHLIPANPLVAHSLSKVRQDQRVRIDGWLVEAKMPGGIWRSSTTREDTGDGACELIYVCALTVTP